jgi:ADP-ribose pyrophosphatase
VKLTQQPAEEVLASGRYLRLVKRGRWEYVDRVNAKGAAVIVAVTPEDKVLLIEQYRAPLDRKVIEMPAGLVGDEGDAYEHFAEAAKRELLEETGYECEEMIEVAHGPPTPGLATELITLFVARGLRRVHDGGGTEHEDIQVIEVPLSEVDAWLRERAAAGMVIDPKVYAGLYFAGRSHRPEVCPVSGHLVYADGTPIEGAEVEFVDPLHGVHATGVTSHEGRFVLSTFEEYDGATEGVHSVSIKDSTNNSLTIAAGVNSTGNVLVKKGRNEFEFRVARPFDLRVVRP